MTITSLVVSPATASLQVGGTQQLTATAKMSDGTSQNATTTSTWSSSSSTVATVNAGLVTAKAGGSATITAIAPDGKTPGTVAITVTVPVALTVTCAAGSVYVGSPLQCTATVQNAASQAGTWKVNGVAGGNDTLGIITGTAGSSNNIGTYNAPIRTLSVAMEIAFVPDADQTKSASANVTVNASSFADNFLFTQVVQTNPTTYVSTLYASSPDGQTQTQLFSRTGNGIAVTGDSWAPDHCRHVFALQTGSGVGLVYLGNACTVATPLPITQNGDWPFFPRISPDGKKLVYTTLKTSTNIVSVVIQNLDGSGRTVMASFPFKGVVFSGADWCSASLIIYDNRADNLLYTRDIGAQASVSTGITGILPSCSPDGKNVIYSPPMDVAGADWYNSYVSKLDGSSAQKLSNVGVGVWSPDGSWIMFQSELGGATFGDIEKFPYPLSSNPTPITVLRNNNTNGYTLGNWK